MARVIAARAVVLQHLPERPYESGAGRQSAKHAPVAHDEQEHERRADEQQDGEEDRDRQDGVAALRQAGGEADGAVRRGGQASMQRVDEVAIERRPVVIDGAAGAGIGGGQRAAVAKGNAALVHGVAAVAGGAQADGDDVGPAPAHGGVFVVPFQRGLRAGIDDGDAAIRIAPEGAPVVDEEMDVVEP